jgi:ABC-2 type transport system permease protein
MIALFALTVRRLLRPSRMVVLGLFFLLPCLVVSLVRAQGGRESAAGFEFVFMFVFIPTTVVPFTALMFASGLIQDEVEEQTLTYLLIRPLPRAVIYAVKLAGSIAVTALLALLCTAVNEAVIYAYEPSAGGNLPGRIMVVAAMYGLVLVAYNAIFGLVGLIFRKSLPIGVVYIILFEGVFASIPFVFRKATVVYYFRALTTHWFGQEEMVARSIRNGWGIDSATAPSATDCMVTLLSAALAFAVVSAWMFTTRELRVKTPETT